MKITNERLVEKLDEALLDWDTAYEDVMSEWPPSEKMTEDRLKIATRNRMREREQEFPEIARWRLRFAIGYRSEEE